MKIYDLLCAGEHRFEGWFNSAADFASQKKRGLLSCPSCGTAEVRRVPSASRVNLGVKAPPAPAASPAASQAPAGAEGKDAFAIAQMLYSRMVDELLAKSEDVGTAFPEEARKIHYEQAPARSIRGKASQEQHDELVEEGIPVARLPIPPTDQWN
jgi:hypothetical protein